MRDNLILRGNTYHVRLAIPADVRSHFGNRKLLSQSLKTGLQHEAKDRARPILLQWKKEINKARQIRAEKADHWRDNLADDAKALHKAMDQSYLYAAKKVEHDVAQKEVADLFLKREVFFRLLDPNGSLGFVDRIDSITEAFLKKRITRIEHVAKQNELFKEAYLQLAKIQFKLANPDINEAIDIIESPDSYKPRSPITKRMLDSWADHLVTQIKTEKTRDRLKQCVQRFSDYLAREGAPLNFDTVHGFLETISPARKTRYNYLWAGRTFWKWANKYSQTFREQFKQQPCPFDGHELPRTGDAAGRKRLAFTQQEIESLHKKASDRDNVPLANLIQLAAFSGARLEEIGRLRPEHAILNEAGEPIGFKIMESKTRAGVRDMPLHPSLTALFKDLMRKASDNDGYLLPGKENKYGNRLEALRKQFSLLKGESFNRGYTFHSIRHSVATLLHQSGVSIEVLPYLLGHETGVFTLSQYSKGPTFEQKAQAVNLLTYNF